MQFTLHEFLVYLFEKCLYIYILMLNTYRITIAKSKRNNKPNHVEYITNHIEAICYC